MWPNMQFQNQKWPQRPDPGKSVLICEEEKRKHLKHRSTNSENDSKTNRKRKVEKTRNDSRTKTSTTLYTFLNYSSCNLFGDDFVGHGHAPVTTGGERPVACQCRPKLHNCELNRNRTSQRHYEWINFAFIFLHNFSSSKTQWHFIRLHLITKRFACVVKFSTFENNRSPKSRILGWKMCWTVVILLRQSFRNN